MAATDTSLFSLTKQVSSSNNSFFKQLDGGAIKIGREESKKMADEIAYILAHRRMLDGTGNGRYPRWDGSGGVKSKLSFRNWASVPFGTDHYAVRYTDPSSEDSYVGILVNGLTFANSDHVWHKSFYKSGKTPQKKNFKSKLVSTNGRLFSSQMPKGLDPFLLIKKQQLIDRIDARIKKEL